MTNNSDLVAASPHWSVPVEKSSGFSPFIAFCFIINYIVGTGFLTIPWAFVQGGLILSTLLLVLAGIASDIAKTYLLETMSRAEEMLDSKLRWVKREGEREIEQVLIPPSNYGAIIDSHELQTRQLPELKRRRATPYLVKNRKFEINTLCRIFLGKPGLYLFTLFISLYTFGVLWAYTSVFSSAMAAIAPIFGNGEEEFNYVCYALIFGLIVVPLSCLELEEQVVIQVSLTGCRFMMLFLMLGTCTQCALDTSIDLGKSNNEAPLFQPAGFHKVLPIVALANGFHSAMPGLSHPVADKKKLGNIFQSTIFFTSLLYGLLGLVLGGVFGEYVEQSSNLNWQGYRGGTGSINNNGDVEGVAWWAKAIALFIVSFPAFDVVSAYPLNAITLGNNMVGIYYGNKVHEMENNRWLSTLFRLIASVPPIFLGIFFRELGVITDYAGTSGIVLTFSIPAILYLKSKDVATTKNFSPNTYYTSYGSSKSLARFLFWFGVTMMVFVIVCLIHDT